MVRNKVRGKVKVGARGRPRRMVIAMVRGRGRVEGGDRQPVGREKGSGS